MMSVTDTSVSQPTLIVILELDHKSTHEKCRKPCLIDVDSDKEGVILLFPSRLRHQVYPFYNCDKERISISGNIIRT